MTSRRISAHMASPGTVRWHIRVLAALAGGVLGPTIAPAQRPSAVTPLVLDGVTVIDVQQGNRIPARRVVIVGNRIRTVGAAGAVRVPTGARVVDARGKYLIPGLWDMHVHPRRAASVFYPLFVANGVTGIRDASSSVPLDTLRLWRREILDGTRVGPPRQLLSGLAIDQAGDCPDAKQRASSGHVCAATPGEARHLVDSLKAAGADIIKTYNLGRAMYLAIASEARRVGLPFGGHIDGKDSLGAESVMEASDSGAGIVDHLTPTGGLDTLCSSRPSHTGKPGSLDQCRPVAERLRRNGTWWVPTLVIHFPIFEGFFGGSPPYMSPASLPIYTNLKKFSGSFWQGEDFRHAWFLDSAGSGRPAPTLVADSNGLLRIAHQVGLPVLAGTDVSTGKMTMERMAPGFSLHAELAMYVAEGLTPLEALQAATLNPAKFLHATDSLGTVAPGKLADLVLLDGDPLADIRNTAAVRAVIANGRYFDRTELDHILAAAQARAKQEPQLFEKPDKDN